MYDWFYMRSFCSKVLELFEWRKTNKSGEIEYSFNGGNHLIVKFLQE